MLFACWRHIQLNSKKKYLNKNAWNRNYSGKAKYFGVLISLITFFNNTKFKFL